MFNGIARIGLTWGSFLEQLVHLGSQSNNVVRRSSPEDQAVPVIKESWLYRWVLKPEERLVNNELLEASGQELLRLLGISLGPVKRIESLDLSLKYS